MVCLKKSQHEEILRNMEQAERMIVKMRSAIQFFLTRYDAEKPLSEAIQILREAVQ